MKQFACFVVLLALINSTVLAGKIEGEKEAIINAVNKYLDATGIQIGELNITANDDGTKTAAGQVSFFGFEHIELKAGFKPGPVLHSFSAKFPEAARISPEKLGKFLSGRSLSSFLPASFPLNTDISISEFSLEFDNDKLQTFTLDFGIGNYSIEGFDGFAIEGIEIGLTVEKPSSPDRKVAATISGDGKIGVIPINLQASLSSDPADLFFSFTATNINLSALLNAFLNGTKTSQFLRFIPESIKTTEISFVKASFNPTSKNFSALCQTNFGESEIRFNGAEADSKSSMLFAIAPPPTVKLSSLSPLLAPLDSIDLSGTAIIVSSLADPGIKPSLDALKDAGELELVKGVNIFSKIKLNEGLAAFLKTEQLVLNGTVNNNYTSLVMDADLDLDIRMGQHVTMKKVVFGMKLGSANPVEFNISGNMEAKIAEDILGFQAKFKLSPAEQQMSGEFFMSALQKKNGTLQKGRLGADGKSDLPEWTNPFGMRGVGLRKLGVSAAIDFKNPILISSLGFTGSARLGTVIDRNKHINGDVTIVVNVTHPLKSLIDVTVKNLAPMGMIEAYVENPKIEGTLKTLLQSGFESAKLLVVPVDGLEAFGKKYDRGIDFDGIISFGSLKGYASFTLNDNGVTGIGSLDQVNWAGGAFQLKGRTSEKPQFSFSFAKNKSPEFFIDGIINLLGLSSETTISVGAAGFEFTTTGKIANLWEATLEAKGKNLSEPKEGIAVRAALRNDLASKLNELVSNKINEGIQTTKTKFQESREKLKTAREGLNDVDYRTTKRLEALTDKAKADQQAMRNEAERAMREKQDFINTCNSNNAASYKRIGQLGNVLPWELIEKAALYTAIEANNIASESAQIAYNGYAATVKGLADIAKDFPNDVLLTDLYAEKLVKQSALDLALKSVDFTEGASVATMEATKYIMDKALGGVFDVKSAEFAGTFGLNKEYKVNAALNFTLADKPYNMVVAIDLNDLASSASRIANELLKESGTLMKNGYAKAFALELKKPVTNNSLLTVDRTLYTGNEKNPMLPVRSKSFGDWTGKSLRIESLYRISNAINTEGGQLGATPISESLVSAQWAIKPVPGSLCYWIESKVKTGQRISIENGKLECTVIHDGALGAHWTLKKIGENVFQIFNRLKPEQRLNIEDGKLNCSSLPSNARSDQWFIRPAIINPFENKKGFGF